MNNGEENVKCHACGYVAWVGTMVPYKEDDDVVGYMCANYGACQTRVREAATDSRFDLNTAVGKIDGLTDAVKGWVPTNGPREMMLGDLAYVRKTLLAASARDVLRAAGDKPAVVDMVGTWTNLVARVEKLEASVASINRERNGAIPLSTARRTSRPIMDSPQA